MINPPFHTLCKRAFSGDIRAVPLGCKDSIQILTSAFTGIESISDKEFITNYLTVGGRVALWKRTVEEFSHFTGFGIKGRGCGIMGSLC